MFDALGIDLRLRGGNAESHEEREDDLVAAAHAEGQAPAAVGESDRLSRAGGQEALVATEARHNARDGDVADTHHRGQVAHAGLSLLGDELADGLDVILGGFVLVRSTRAAEAGGPVAEGLGGHAGE